MEPKIGTFHDVLTGEIIVRELTAQEIADFGEVTNYVVTEAELVVEETPVVDDPVEGEQP